MSVKPTTWVFVFITFLIMLLVTFLFLTPQGEEGINFIKKAVGIFDILKG